MRNNDEPWSRCLAQLRTHIRPISDTAETVCYQLTLPPLWFKHSNCKPGRFMHWSGNLSIIRAIRHGNMTGPFEAIFSWRPAWPFWSLSLHYNVCSAWCWRIADVLMFQRLTETDLLGSCCHIMLPLAAATCVAVYGVLCVLIQALPTPRRLGSFWFCFKRTGIEK